MTHLEGRGEIEFRGLFLNRFCDARATMTGIDAPEPRHTVKYLATLRGDEVHTRRAGDDPRRCLELPIGRERHPVSVELGLHRGVFQVSR